TCGRRHHGKNSGRGFSGQQYCLVAAASGHRGKGVHALRPRRAGHELDGKGGHAGLRDLLNNLGRAERPKKSNERLTATHPTQVRFAGYVIRSVAQHLHQQAGYPDAIYVEKGAKIVPDRAAASTMTSSPALTRLGITTGT